jgi:uncharacterized protein
MPCDWPLNDVEADMTQVPDDENTSLIEYPSSFPIKVMGLHTEAFIDEMVALAQQHDPVFDPLQHLERRPSSSGKYMGLTVTIAATSREQLDNLYRAYTSHPLVKYVL